MTDIIATTYCNRGTFQQNRGTLVKPKHTKKQEPTEYTYIEDGKVYLKKTTHVVRHEHGLVITTKTVRFDRKNAIYKRRIHQETY